MSFPSSLKSSSLDDKQNINPNNQKSKISRLSPESIRKGKCGAPLKPQQFYSVSNSINERGRQEQEQSNSQHTNNSLKILFKGINSPIKKNQRQEKQTDFVHLVREVFRNKEMGLREIITFCEEKQIYNRQDICGGGKNPNQFPKPQPKSTKRKKPTLKQLLGTDLGQLIIEQICQIINQGQLLELEQQKVVEFLVRDGGNEKICQEVVRRQFELVREQLSYQRNYRVGLVD